MKTPQFSEVCAMANKGLKNREIRKTRPKKYDNAQRMVKLFDNAKAGILKSKGFSYLIERVGSGLSAKEVTAFFETPELMDYINSHYTEQDYYYDYRLNF